jgi:SAM-dependent methyltransferase
MTTLPDRARQQYQGAAGQRYHQQKRAIPESAFPWVARLRASKIQPHIRPADIVLEYGVGLGWNLAALQCARKIGLDVGEFLESAVRQRGIEFVTSPAAIPHSSADAVICHHALEHAWQPTEVLADSLRMLRPSGRLLLFVPYEKERRYRRFDPDEPNHHLYSWNVQTLGRLVQDAGFLVQTASIGRFGQERFAAIWAARLGLGEGGFRAWRYVANTLKNEREVRVVATKPA